MKMKWPAFRFGCLLLGGVAISMLSVHAQVAHEATAGPTALAISGVEISQQGQQTNVRISGSGELRCHTSRLDGPPRLVLDFGDTRLAYSKNKLASQFYPVQDVRLGQPQNRQSRIVIDLAQFVPYTVQAEGSSLTVSFTAPGSNGQTGNVSTATAQPVSKATRPKLLEVKAPAMPLPSMLTEADIAFADAKEPVAPSTKSVGPTTDNPSATTTAQEPVSVEHKKYTGDPISVNLKDVDLKDFFRLIHEISGLNVVLDPSVRGSVTLVLDDVPWDQALDIVLQNNGLTAQVDGNVLRVATQDTLRREADQKRDLAKAQSDAVETVTVTRVLSYAKADTAMVAVVKKFVTPRGDVYADPRTNTLIIKDIPSSIPKVEDLLRQLDRKSRQVEIDARVVSASRTFARDIGTQFGFSTPTGATGNTILGGLTGTGSALSPVVHSILPPLGVSAGNGGGGSIPLNTNLGATAPTSGFTFSTQGHNYAIDFILSMMESRGAGKVLSEPKGITQNNEKLTVKQGTEIPIQTTINNTISVQYVDAVLKLEVTPQISADGTVFLDITVENTSIDNTILVQGTPGLDTQSTQTKVLINDGGTVVIGGVVVNNQTTEVDQVPLLGSVPLIGNLFKHTTINVSTQELLFFVTPRILPS